jgi:hypothetical protein
MAWHRLENNEKIATIIEYLISNQTGINVFIEGEETEYSSRFLEILHRSTGLEGSSPKTNGMELVIEKLLPEKDNNLIPNSTNLSIEFSLKEFICRCNMNYLTLSGIAPHYKIVTSFPGRLELQEKRKEDRYKVKFPKFITAVIKLWQDIENPKSYELRVLEYSYHGFGLLVLEENFELLEILETGDELKDITIFSESALIQLEGTVRHKTKIIDRFDENVGCYILGIESNHKIDFPDLGLEFDE